MPNDKIVIKIQTNNVKKFVKKLKLTSGLFDTQNKNVKKLN